jgi:pimeloyl-ACP methyl ester carboxylesterase
MRIIKFITAALLLFSFAPAYAQTGTESDQSVVNNNVTLYGTLYQAASAKPTIVVLLIAGSGPTDRNGNNPSMQNNSLSMLAGALAANGISSLRYDKRGVGQSKAPMLKEDNLRFEDFISDAEAWIKKLKADKRFSKVVVAGHSEGSLIGMIAVQHVPADLFISISGAGRPADEVLKDQLKDQPKQVVEESAKIIASLKEGKTVAEVPSYLNTLFRPSVQPYLISWFKYDPAVELNKVKAPTVIVHGMNDIQVNLDEAMKLAQARPSSSLMVVKGMNHILKKMDENKDKNIASYNDPHLPLSVDLVSGLVEYIYNNAR